MSDLGRLMALMALGLCILYFGTLLVCVLYELLNKRDHPDGP